MSDFEFSHTISLRQWMLAALGALSLHAACFALAYEYLQREEPDPEFGAVGLEIGVVLMAPPVEPSDLPPGPDAEEAVNSPTAAEQAKVEPVALPKEVPIETDDPDRIVAQLEAKQPQTEPPVLSMPASPAEESAAAQGMARPSSEIAEASQRSVTPLPGTGDSPQRVRATWEKELVAHFDRHKRYPPNRSLDRLEILVNFELDSAGQVLSSSIERGSGDAAYDGAAIDMIRRSNPVPKPPALVVQQGLRFMLPVIFRTKRIN